MGSPFGRSLTLKLRMFKNKLHRITVETERDKQIVNSLEILLTRPIFIFSDHELQIEKKVQQQIDLCFPIILLHFIVYFSKNPDTIFLRGKFYKSSKIFDSFLRSKNIKKTNPIYCFLECNALNPGQN